MNAPSGGPELFPFGFESWPVVQKFEPLEFGGSPWVIRSKVKIQPVYGRIRLSYSLSDTGIEQFSMSVQPAE